MKELHNNIKMYEYNNFYIYIIEHIDHYGYYLQHKDYGFIKFIYGIPKEQGIEELKEYIKNSLYSDCMIMIEDLEMEE